MAENVNGVAYSYPAMVYVRGQWLITSPLNVHIVNQCVCLMFAARQSFFTLFCMLCLLMTLTRRCVQELCLCNYVHLLLLPSFMVSMTPAKLKYIRPPSSVGDKTR